MSIVELLLVAIGLSMDAFAVSICKGLRMKKINLRHALIIALFFGGFQALMPLAGWFLGSRFDSYISSMDHWIVFALLSFIGGKMIYEALRFEGPTEDEGQHPDTLDVKELAVMAVATSIDALAVGISFAFLRVHIWSATAMIGAITFLVSLSGVCVGNFFGARFKERAEIAGGAILVLIGLKILLEHLGIIAI